MGVTYCQLTIENQNAINQRAKSRKNGVFQLAQERDNFMNRVAELTKELEEARKDAERYRYIKRAILRQPGGPYAFATYMGWIGSTFERGFDEAIDAALSKIGGGE